MSFSIDAECGMPADWVGVVVIVALPNVALLVEYKMTGEEEHPWAHLAALTDPVTIEMRGVISLRWQNWWMMKICYRDDLTCYTAIIISLKERERIQMTCQL